MTDAPVAAEARKRLYHSLDGLRGVAAVVTVCWHYYAFLAPIVVRSGYLSVDLFFLMSGFVIANAYQHRFARSLNGAEFLLLRYIRLFPLYLIGTLAGLLAMVAPLLRAGHAPGAWGNIAAVALPALLMLPGLGFATPTLLYPLNFPAWSLFSELVGNAVYGFIARLRHGWLLAATIAGAGAGLVIAARQFGSLDGGWSWQNWWVGPIRLSFSFFLGVAGFNLHAAGRLPVVRFPLLPLYLIVIVVLDAAPPPQIRLIYDLAAVFIIFPAVVWLCIVNEPRRNLRLFTISGLISYPIYTIHGPLLLLLQLIGRHRYGYQGFDDQVAARAPWIGVVVLAVLLGLSWLLAVIYDVPARRLLTRAANRLRRVPVLVPAWKN